jgi:hypothetical protein
MVVALLTADKQTFLDALWMTGDQGLTDVVPFVYLLFLIWLAIAGPGPLSLDALIARWLRLGRPCTSVAPDANPRAAGA